MDTNKDLGYELDWEDEIEKDSEYTLLPEGDYDFEVIKYERGRHNGSEKLPACSKATVTIRIDAPEGSAMIQHHLFLHSKTEGLLCAFFLALGLREKGERGPMPWNLIAGSTGRCNVYIDKWTNDKRETRESNKIKKFYPAEKKASAPAAKFETGRF